MTRCDILDIGLECLSDCFDFLDDDGGSFWGGLSVGGDVLVIEVFSRVRYGRVKEL